jgi:signal transduction histidine kinase
MLGDRIQMQQVLVNLVRNAMDATEGLPPERRVVGVSTADVADGIELRVTDRGHGIAAEHRQRLFEAFFTTKSRGMGMGLSIVRSIVEAHGGGVAAAAVAPQGTVFTVQLPRRAEPSAADAPASIEPVGVAR